MEFVSWEQLTQVPPNTEAEEAEWVRQVEAAAARKARAQREVNAIVARRMRRLNRIDQRVIRKAKAKLRALTLTVIEPVVRWCDPDWYQP